MASTLDRTAKRIKTRRTKPLKFGGVSRRSYVLDRNEAIDHRTGKTAQAKRILDGDIEALR